MMNCFEHINVEIINIFALTGNIFGKLSLKVLEIASLFI